MALFRYEAIDRTGQTVMGAMQAATEAEVQQRLIAKGFRPGVIIPPVSNKPSSAQNSVPPLQPGIASSVTSSIPVKGKVGKANAYWKSLFFRQFCTLVHSGISLYQSLDSLAARARPASLAKAAAEMRDEAKSGGRISDAMARYPELFQPHVIGSVRAGETGGFMEIVLDEIAAGYEMEVQFYKNLWIPKALVVQELFALAIAEPLFPYIFPKGNYREYLILAFGRNCAIALVILLLCKIGYALFQKPRFRALHDRLILKIPVFGDLSRQNSLSTFVRMLRRLSAAGLGPIVAWEGAMNAAPNSVIRERLAEAWQQIRNNAPLHDAFSSTHLFATEAEQLIATGVMSGQVIEMLDQVTQFYQQNVSKAFTSSRFTLFRMSIIMFLILMGAVLIIMTKTYFDSIFKYADTFTSCIDGLLYL
jgi:type IV pilus assembly protein PilC